MLHYMVHAGLVSWDALLSKVLIGHHIAKSPHKIISGGLYLLLGAICILCWMSCRVVKSVGATHLPI